MATKTVQDLALEGTPAGTDHLIIDDGTTTRKATVSSVVNAGVDLSSVAENIVPDTDNVRSLGTAAKTWKDVFVGPGSLYVNGQKVLEDDAGTIVVSADANQNLDIRTTGTGDIGLTTAVGGKVEVGGTLEIAAGKNITSSDGNAISFTNGLDMNGEAITSAGAITATSFSGDGSNLTGITATALAADSVNTSEIAANAVNTSEIAANAVTDTELNSAKLNGIEDGATADQTQADINALGITATSVDLGNWTVTESAGLLYFATGGVNKMKLDASGDLTVIGNITAYGTV